MAVSGEALVYRFIIWCHMNENSNNTQLTGYLPFTQKQATEHETFIYIG